MGRNWETHCLELSEKIMRQLGVKTLAFPLSFQKLAPSGVWVQSGGFIVNQGPLSLWSAQRFFFLLLLCCHDIFREQFSNSYYFKALWSSDCLSSPAISSTCNVSWQLLMNHHYILAGYPAQWIMKLPNLFMTSNLSNFSRNNEEDRGKIPGWKWVNTSSSTFALSKSCEMQEPFGSAG